MGKKPNYQKKQRVKKLAKELLEQPSLIEGIEEMLALVKVEKNTIESADEAEKQVIGLTRKMGQKLLEEWCIKKHDGCLDSYQKQRGVIVHGKKKLKWHTLLGDIKLEETVLRQSRRGPTFRPFCKEASVVPRGYSKALQRAMSDFGIERSFAKAAEAIHEHYGIVVPESAERCITLKHANRVPEVTAVRTLPSDGPDNVIAQTDGSFVPVVYFKEGTGDKRNRRGKEYKETRLCAAYAQKSTTVYYANGGFCDVEKTGNALGQAALKAGWNKNKDARVHCVGDGASWVARQAHLQFGSKSFLLDFYHLCEYLQAAALTCSPENPQKWRRKQCELLKKNKITKVLEALDSHREQESVPDENAPVRCAHRYITNRLDQLDYQSAIENDLPIGSGIIESAHGHLIQDRLKKSGATWDITNAEAMINLRVARANNQWNQLWSN